MKSNLDEIVVTRDIYLGHTGSIIIEPCKNKANNDLWHVNEEKEIKDPFRSIPHCIHPQKHDDCMYCY